MNQPGLYLLAVAKGDDGKYEVVDGKQRVKWNKYQITRIAEVRRPSKPKNYYMNGTLSPGTIFLNNDILTVQNRLAQNIKGHNFNLAVSVAEGKETVSMVVNTLQNLGKSIRHIKRGQFASAARVLGITGSRTNNSSVVRSRKGSATRRSIDDKDVSSRWLELQYGWLPLLSDVRESAQAYEALTSGPRKTRVSASLTKAGVKNYSASPVNYSGLGPYKGVIRVTAELQEDISAPRSLGLQDPLTVAWELIPYSFVVDWFIPIGTYLENLNTLQGLKARFITTDVVNFSYSLLPLHKDFSGATTNCRGMILNRNPSGSLAVPRPNVNSLPEAMSPKRIWNAIALAHQRFF